MGRQTFKINPEVLERLRKDSSKTQMDLGIYLRKKSGKAAKTARDLHSATSYYQRIEKTGKTSRKTAEHLAELFHVSVEELQGAPVNTRKRIETLLNSLYTKRTCSALNDEFADYVERGRWSNFSFDEPPTNEERKLRQFSSFAISIAERIEALQWSQSREEINSLKAITQMTESELLSRTYVEGNWLVTGTMLEDYKAVVIRGIWGMFDYIERIWAESFLRVLPKERVQINIKKDGLWYRIHAFCLTNPSEVQSSISFACCHPDGEKGILLAEASTKHKNTVEFELQKFAESKCNKPQWIDADHTDGNVI